MGAWVKTTGSDRFRVQGGGKGKRQGCVGGVTGGEVTDEKNFLIIAVICLRGGQVVIFKRCIRLRQLGKGGIEEGGGQEVGRLVFVLGCSARLTGALKGRIH